MTESFDDYLERYNLKRVDSGDEYLLKSVPPDHLKVVYCASCRFVVKPGHYVCATSCDFPNFIIAVVRSNDEPTVQDEAGDECAVCHENLRSDDGNSFGPAVPFSPTCPHSFHFMCLKEWVRTRVLQGSDVTCPLCRQVNNALIEDMVDG